MRPCIPVSCGELADKLTILAIKADRFSDVAQQRNVVTELEALQDVWRSHVTQLNAVIDGLLADLRATNEILWDVENSIRDCDARQDFGPDFIALAKKVYTFNAQRAGIKRRINDALGSSLVEEKDYRSEVRRSGSANAGPGAA